MGKESEGWSLIETYIGGPDCNILFSTFKIFFFGVKFSFSSLIP
jgi:hypothetical protein